MFGQCGDERVVATDKNKIKSLPAMKPSKQRVESCGAAVPEVISSALMGSVCCWLYTYETSHHHPPLTLSLFLSKSTPYQE